MNNDITVLIGLLITPAVEVLKALKLPKKLALYVVILLGVVGGVVVSWGQAPFEILLSAVKAAGTATLTYELYKKAKG